MSTPPRRLGQRLPALLGLLADCHQLGEPDRFAERLACPGACLSDTKQVIF